MILSRNLIGTAVLLCGPGCLSSPRKSITAPVELAIQQLEQRVRLPGPHANEARTYQRSLFYDEKWQDDAKLSNCPPSGNKRRQDTTWVCSLFIGYCSLLGSLPPEQSDSTAESVALWFTQEIGRDKLRYIATSVPTAELGMFLMAGE